MWKEVVKLTILKERPITLVRFFVSLLFMFSFKEGYTQNSRTRFLFGRNTQLCYDIRSTVHKDMH